MLALLGIIPGIGTLIQAVTTAMFNAKVKIYQAKTGADKDVAVAAVQAATAQEHENTAKLSIFASNKFLTFLLIAFAIPLVAFEWKVIIYDKMLGLGSTPELSGQVASWAQSVIYFLFGAPTAMGIGKMWFGRKDQ